MQKFGLLGEKLSHSFSPQIHKYFYDDPYSLFEVSPDKVETFLKESDFSGINVTIPYKKNVIPFCHNLSDIAKEIGSVNTIVKKGGALYGDNTDYYGFAHLSESLGVNFEGKKVLILGSGGASLTVQTYCRHKKAEFVVISRSGENNYENISLHYDADIIVNTTPLGMYPHNGISPLDITPFKNLCGVIDLIYNPLKTSLILKAEEAGIPAAGGLLMLIAQAKRAAELFIDTSYDDALIKKIQSDMESRIKNIVLIGMPGCGKSSVAKKLSSLLNRELLDTDELIEEKYGTSPAVIIKTKGEDAFRKTETEILSEVSKQIGKIIATGGGIVTREENLPLIKQNSLTVYLCRPIECLATENRPLSERDGVKTLFEKRKYLYEKFADIKINCESIDSSAEKIKEMLNL